jgi:hypothetical protein
MGHRIALLSLVVSIACGKAPPPANPEFNDAVRYLLRDFEGEEVDLAFALRELEEQIYKGMDVESSNPEERALTQANLRSEDVDELNGPPRDLQLNMPISVAGVSAFGIEEHKQIQMLTDHTPVEEYSPNHYVRTFNEGRPCWEARECTTMRTWNDLTKENAMMTIDYAFFKDFRWIDLALPDPEDVVEGEPAEADGKSRMAYIARSWTKESFEGRKGANWIHQSYTIEVWLPRDGKGFRSKNRADSRGNGGLLRMLGLWSETELNISMNDDAIAAFTRTGINNNFTAGERWLEDHAR